MPQKSSYFRPRRPAAEDEDTDDEIERVLRENAARETYDRRKEENDAESEDTDDEIERVLRENQQKDQQQAKREKDDTAKAGVTTPKKKNVKNTIKEETDRETKRGKYERKENREDDCDEEEEAARTRQPKLPPSRGHSRQVFPVFLI
jgi:hypothetical protein